MFYVYVLKGNRPRWLYVGYTQNLKRRFGEHCSGLATATRPYRPLELVFYEAYKAGADARRREKYLKSSKGKRALKLMLTMSLL